MTTKHVFSGLAFLTAIILSPAAVRAILTQTCLTGTATVVANDPSQVRAVRALVDAGCVCSRFDGTTGKAHKDYVKCAAKIITAQAAVPPAALRPQCKATVKQYYSQSTCGTNPTLHDEPCIQTNVRTGKITCSIRATTRSDGITPTTLCATTATTTRVACSAYTTCIDAADTNGNLIIAAPDDNGMCVPAPTPSPTPSPSPIPQSGTYPTGVPFRGINRAGLEYGDDWDGWTGQTWYDQISTTQTASELAYYKSKGMNVVRLPISWERVQHTLNGSLTSAYVTLIMNYINAATSSGLYVVLDLHNYNRYAEGVFDSNGNQLSSGYTQRIMGDGALDISHLADVWVKLTNLVLNNPKVILGLMNEAHDFPMTSTAWFAGVQAVMNAIRAAESVQAVPVYHLILVPNTRGSDVDHWSSYSPGDIVLGSGNGGPLDSVVALTITDSANSYAFDMHAYQDYPTAGTSYSNLISTVTNWAETNNKQLFLSELGSVAGATNGAVGIGGLLAYMNASDSNSVWLGWTPWNLDPYSLTDQTTFSSDLASMSWYTPFLIPDYLGN